MCYLTLTSLNLSKPKNLKFHLENWFGNISVKYDKNVFSLLQKSLHYPSLLSLFHYSPGFSLITRQDESLCQRLAEILLFAFTSLLHHPNYKPLMRHFQHLTDLKREIINHQRIPPYLFHIQTPWRLSCCAEL